MSYTLQDLGPGVALDVSDDGHVCGRYDSMERDAGAWYWDGTKRVIIMGHTSDGLFFRAHTATEIRPDGTVMGDLLFVAMDPSSVRQFIWSPAEPDLLAIVGDGAAPLSTRVTNAGLTVGSTLINGQQHAITTETKPGLLTHDLNFQVQAPGWVLVAANAINKRGQICGGGVLNGKERAFLLTPNGNTVSAVESYAGFVLPSEHNGRIVRIMAQDTEWNGEWRKLGQVMVENPPQLWVDTSAPRRRGREYKVERV